MIKDLGHGNFREGSKTPILTANMSNGQGSSGLVPHLYMTWDLGPGTLDLGFDNEGSMTPIITANMSNGQGSSGLVSHLYMINE